ncbi:hypothetical protein [Microbacterium sp. MMO-10]|uniref:hypothetical protein n=1 Tax=Microbacterium sp. MMO-10 TaxID=3081272 RepID=UPI00301AABD5
MQIHVKEGVKILTMFAFFGAILIASGIVMLTFRRRVRKNLIQAGLVRDGSRLPTLYAISIAMGQVLLGAILLAYASLNTHRESAHVASIGPAIVVRTGAMFVPLVIALTVGAVLGAWGGCTLIGRAGRSRKAWFSDSDHPIQGKDARRIVFGTVLCIYSVISLIFTVLLLVWRF